MVRVPGHNWQKRLLAKAFDVAGRLPGSDPLLPPFSMRRFVGEAAWLHSARDFRATGADFAQKLRADAGLTPEATVLDLGSGCGRLAVPLTRILAPRGRYIGLEISLPLVQWCNQHISIRYRNFRFVHCDLYSALYNPQGSENAASYRLPVESGACDVIVATSVFTHLLPVAAAHYLQECSRALAGGGRLFATFFLLTDELPQSGLPFNFEHEYSAEARVIDRDQPEAAVGYCSGWVLGQAEQCGLSLFSPIRWGAWAGRPYTYSGQDVVILQKN